MGARESGTDLWRGGVVPYEINPDLGNTDTIHDAIVALESSTTVRFVRRYLEDEQGDFIRFSKQTQGNANSRLGRTGGEQFVNASTNHAGTLVHEICHALGMTHEHQRQDRDDHIVFHADRVTSDHDQYAKRDTPWMTPEYDFQSIMHYHAGSPSHPWFESKTGTPPPAEIGGRGVLTDLDAAFLARLYPATPVIRRTAGDDGAGVVRHTSLCAVPGANGTAVAVNAVVNSDGDYQVLAWRIRDNGVIERMADPVGGSGGGARAPKIVALPSGFVSAMVDADGDLLLIHHDGSLARVGDTHGQAGDVQAFDVVTNVSRVITPCVTASGRLLVIEWEVRSDGSVKRLRDSGSGGPVASSVSAVMLHEGDPGYVAILYTDAASRLVLSVWSIGQDIHRIADSGDQLGSATLARVVKTPSRNVVVACRAENDGLLLIPFSVDLANSTVTRVVGRDARAGTVRELAVISRPYGLLTAVVSESGTLLLIKWRVDADGAITRLGESSSQAGEGSAVSVAALPFPTTATVCTTLRDSSGRLLPITWDDADGPGELDVVADATPVLDGGNVGGGGVFL